MGTNRISGFFETGTLPKCLPPALKPPPPGGQLPGPKLTIVDDPQIDERIGQCVLHAHLRVGEHVLQMKFRRSRAQDMCRQLGHFAADKEMPWFTWTIARYAMDVVRAMCVVHDREMRRRLADGQCDGS